MQKAIVAIYLVIMILLGLALRSRIKNISDFLIAGRNLGILLTTATFAGIQLGAGVILGGADLALLIAWSLSTVVFILVTLMTSSEGGKA